MKVLFLHQYFKTPDEPGGLRSYWVIQEMIREGNEVTVICYNKNLKRLIERTVVDDIAIIRIKVNYSNKMDFYHRLYAFVKFMLICTYISLKEKKVDMVYASSTPLTIGFPALILKKFKKIPFVFEVMDLWPEVPIQMGALKNKFIIKLARWFEKTIYKNASHIIAASPGMYKGVVDSGTPSNQVSMIPNFSKIDIFWPRQKDLKLAAEMEISNSTFKLIYFGALGRANAIDYILETADLLKNENIEFLFIGSGAMLPMILETKKNRDLNNIKYLGLFNLARTSELVNLCDVSLVIFKNLPILATNSPNKLFDSLSAGKPIIVNSNGWTKVLVESNNCGLFVDPESPRNFAKKILLLKNSPKLCQTMGNNSRKLAETKYDKSILCKELYQVIEKTKTLENLNR